MKTNAFGRQTLLGMGILAGLLISSSCKRPSSTPTAPQDQMSKPSPRQVVESSGNSLNVMLDRNGKPLSIEEQIALFEANNSMVIAGEVTQKALVSANAVEEVCYVIFDPRSPDGTFMNADDGFGIRKNGRIIRSADIVGPPFRRVGSLAPVTFFAKPGVDNITIRTWDRFCCGCSHPAFSIRNACTGATEVLTPAFFPDPGCSNLTCDGQCGFHTPFVRRRRVFDGPAPDLGECDDCQPQDNLLFLSNFPTEVFPSEIGTPNSTVITAEVITSQGDPVPNETVLFEPRTASLGGHSHNGDRPKGRLIGASSCITNQSGKCQVVYKATKFGGREIVAGMLETDPSVEETIELTVRTPLESFNGGLGMTLSGQTATHPDNHFIDGNGAGSLLTLGVFDYHKNTGAVLQINDISLEWGGGFDIPEAGKEWNVDRNSNPALKGAHVSHRTGKDVDIENLNLLASLRPHMRRFGWRFIPEGPNAFPHFRFTGLP